MSNGPTTISTRAFRKLIRARGNNGRDTLYSFMRHWLYVLLHKNDPALVKHLPQSFAIGQAPEREIQTGR